MMKRYLLAIFVTLLAVVACSKDLDGDRNDDNNAIDEVKTVLTFTGERPQLDPSTKTAWDGENIVWSANDKIKIGFTYNGNWWGQNAAYASNAASPNNKIKFYQSNGVNIDSENPSVGTFTVPSGFSGSNTSGDYVFYAVFPGPKIGIDQINTAEIPIILNPKQIPAADSFDKATDILVGQSRTVTSTGLPTEPLTIFWKRVVAHGNFTLKNFQDINGFSAGETISRVVFTAQEGANLAGKEVLSVTDGTFSGTATSNVITLDGANLSFATEDGKTNLNVWLSVIPVTLTSLDVIVETNKATYHKSWSSISKELKVNARNTMGINMSNATRTAKTESYYWVLKDIDNITPNDVFVIVAETNRKVTYAMTNTNGSGRTLPAQSVTVSGNKLTNASIGTNIQWTLSKDDDYYTFHPVGSPETWLYSTGNSVQVGNNSNKYFTLHHGNPGEYLTNLYNIAANNYLRVNNSSWSYTSSYPNTQTVAFYVRVDASSHHEHNVTFSTSTYNRNVGNYTSSFVNTCDGLDLTLTNVNNGNRFEQWTIMRAGRENYASVATITTNDAIPEVIRSVTLSVTQITSSNINSVKLIVSPTSDFSSTTEYEFDGFWAGEVWVTIREPEAYMYYKIVIDHKAASSGGQFRFDKIIYSE